MLECNSQLHSTLISFPITPRGRQYGDEFCALDLRVLGFHIVVYNKAKQIAKPIYLSTPYGSLDYRLCKRTVALVLWLR